MNKFIIKNYLLIIFTFLICALGFFLRSQNYASVPLPGESRDEFSFTWLGLSLLQTGQPIATSGLNAYSHNWKYINVSDVFHGFANASPFPLDSSWFDHPPLFSLIPGAYTLSQGLTQFSDASIPIIRRPMLFLGTFNLLLVIIFGVLIFGPKVALIAGLIYATNPLIIISSRLVQAENLLLTLFLLSIISFYLYHQRRQYFYFWLSISLSGLATLVKLSGISVGLSLLLLTLTSESKEKIKKSLTIILGTALITLFFPLYGYFYNWSLFLNVFSSNALRYFRDGLAGFYWLISKTNVTRTLLDGWVLLAWFSLFYISPKIGKIKKLWYLVVPTLSYLLIYLIFGSEGYGWYKFPFYPFLFLVLAWAINYSLQKNNLFFSMLTLLLAGGVTIDKFFPPENLQNYIWFFRFGCLLLLSIFLLPHFHLPHFPQKKYSRFIIWSVFALCLLINLWVNLQITPSAWYKIN